ncbi:hypothetical protein [Desulfolucanica intricata]|uniref:hypothetical protein n=1 Tax=Desulfolucanica intricata TaxID=1285191 RepID=UPI00082D684F|nr:hypothetical protein [Desulfolucanica intricata]
MDKTYPGDKEDSEILLRRKKIALYWLLGTIYTAFLGMQLGRIQAIADFNYNLHEVMFLPVNIAFFLVPVEFLIYMFFVIKCYIKNKKNI